MLFLPPCALGKNFGKILHLFFNIKSDYLVSQIKHFSDLLNGKSA